MATFGEYTKKKKKEQSVSGKSFTEYTSEKLDIDIDDIAPISTISPTVTTKPTVTTSDTKKSLFSDGYDFGDISRTILRSTGNKEQKQSSFDANMAKKYSTMSLSDLEKNLARIEKEEKEHKGKNGGKIVNTLSKVGSYLTEGQTGQSGSATRAKSQANIDKINDYTREKEILNTYRKQRATEEYLGGLNDKQLQLLDDIVKADDLEKAKPLVSAMQGDNADMAGIVYHQLTKGDMDASDDAFTTLSKQLKKKLPDKGNDEIYELINNMVELRKSQVNAEEKEKLETQSKELAADHPVASFALSRASNLIGGIAALPELAFQWNNEYGLDTNAPGFLLTHTSKAIDEQVQLDHDWKIKIGDSDVDAFDLLYNVGTGVVDNVGRLVASGGNTTLAGAMMFTQGTTQSIIEGKEKGYSDSKALTLGLLSGTFEAISEKMSLDIILGSSGGALKTLAKSLLAEGTEEVTSNWLNRIAEQFANGKHSDLSKMYEAYKSEGLTDAQAMAEVVLNMVGEDVESFVVGGLSGALLGGGVSIANAIQNNTKNIELTENEQKVVDKVVEDRIIKEVENGEKVDSKKRNKIYDEVIKELEKGRISTDTIESILGGEEYEAYKKAKDSTDANITKGNEVIKNLKQTYDMLQKEYESLNELDLTKAKLGDYNRQSDLLKKQAEIRDRIKKTEAILVKLNNDTKVSDLKTKLGQNVFDLVKDSRLRESYLEIARNDQKFETDTSKYTNEIARQTVQNAIDSGYIGNSNASHEFVDFAAKLSSDRGYVIEFVKTKDIEKLKQGNNEYNIEADGKKINAFVSEEHKKIFVNMDKTGFDSLIGHEVTHTLEQAKSYGDLAKAVKSYLGEEEYKKIFDKKTETYKGLNADIEKEIVADFCGERLLTDYDFVKHLSTENRNVFQKVWDEIKYLYKIATAGSKEARQLEKVKKNFEKAYRESAKTQKSTTDGGVKMSIKYTRKMDYDEQIKGYFDGTLQGSNSIYIGEPSENLQKIGFSAHPFAMNQGDIKKSNKKTAKNTNYSRHGVPRKFFRGLPKHINEAVIFIEREDGITIVTDYPILDKNDQPTYVIAGVLPNTTIDTDDVNLVKSVYPLDNFVSKIEKAAETGKLVITDKQKARKMFATIGVQFSKPSNIFELSKEIITQNFEKSSENTEYSLSDEQESYFKDSKVRDENGNLKVMYHGTSKGGHTVFDTYGSNYGLFGQGSYFTDNKSVAESYTNKGKGNNKQVYETYLNITNPIDMDARADVNAWAKALPDADFTNCTTNEDCYRAMEEYFEDEQYSKYEASEIAMDVIQGMGYDGITHIGGGRVNADGTRHQVYIAFEPEQIKNIDNIAPTSDPDIRYSLTEDSEGNKLTEKQSEYFANSKAVDRNGNLLKVYHTTKNDFTVFDKARKGEATEDANTYLGFFFTDDAEYMQNFPEFENGKTESYYLDMKNPIDMTDISREAFMDIVEVMGGDVGDASILFDEELEAAHNRAKVRGDNNVSLQLGHLLDELTGEFYYNDFITELKPHYDELMSKGYDGVINYMDELFGVKEYIVLDSHQAKLTSNKNPSADADVRYSLSDSEQSNNDVKVLNGSSIVKYSLSTWTPETQTKVRNNLIKAGYDGDQVDKWIKDTNGVASVIAANKDRLDFVAADNQVMLKDNQEYIKTLDASTLCAKRLVYQGTFDAIQHRMPNTMLSSDDLIDLLNMMKEHGVQTPCGVCYVESRRRHLGKFAQDWLNNYNGEYKPNLDEVTTSDGLEVLRKSHPQTYKDFVDAMNRKGSSNPKVVQLRTEYRNEIMSLTPSQISKIEAIGGLRVQSFSDFETPHMLDMMQAVMDMSAKGLHSQAYTKVPNFAWVFGDTGIKINLSLIAEGDGFDSDGNLAFSSVEGIDFDEAMRLRDAYSQNVGTIIVGANDKHILACMADDRIDFIIPFHRSGWGMKELEMMGMTSYTDYTYGQKEHDLETGKGLANLYPPDYWDYTLSGKENAERYLNLCAKTGREPKFSRFLVNNGDGSYSLQPDGSTDGYWKTLIDFKMYDNEGNGATQQKVQPNFNMAEAYRVLNEYEGGANSLPVANDVVEEFVAKHKNGTLHSLSEEGEAPSRYSRFNRENILYRGGDDIAPTVSKTEQVEGVAPTVAEDIAPTQEYEAIEPRPDALSDEEEQWARNKMARADKVEDTEAKPTRRSELHQNIVDSLKDKFKEKGFDFDEVLKKAKNLSTFSTVDNIPQRVMEKALGYKQGQILADETVNKVAQNESEGIKWLNSFTDRKNGVLAQISKQYNIKPGSKKSAAAQMYAEGFYVDKDNKIIKYGDEELAIDFPDAKVQENIKGLARDERIRQIYDDTLAAINESRKRNLYPEIPRLDNYFLHFRAMEDTFSRLGLPFNPNDIRAKDLPTDLNGVTADLKPGQPYFASAMHREGMRTSFDLLGGLERYLSSAKNQIYHIDDIQTLRALRNYIADSYGQGKGLEGLDNLSEEEIQEKIKQVYGSHLSTFAKFLNEEANVLAGKTPLIDRGVEGVIGRRGITFLNTLNGQVGSNMVGWNISSSLTNFLPVAQTLAKGSKVDFTKAFAQTVASKIGSIFGKTDSFVENNPTIIRRKGAERFYRTPFQKIGDTGYVLMSAVDDISTELIVRTKYNELVRKGMDEQKASFEADKWTSRLMGDRSLGQQPQLYNSKVFGLITKFQLEVRNQLDSQFYDTIQETKVSNEKIENGLLRNAKTAAKVTSVFVQLAAVQHLYGMVFESIAGYNPAFDIVEVLIKTLGFDDDEEDEDTVLDNIQEGFLALLEDLPYTSTFTGGRIPISSALPIGEIFKGKDQYGNEVSRLDTLKEAAPYYFLPTGFGQIKKTVKGLGMFSDDHPVTGSYTDSGSLRFPVEDTPLNRIQAGIFGQYANENARTYFDEGYAPLKEKQIQEYKDVDMPTADYWKYREGLAGLKNLKEKGDYIGGLDLPISKKNILINNIADRETPIDMTDYNKYSDFEEFDFATRYPEKYAVLQQEGISVKEYKEKYEETAFMYTDDFSWAANNPEKYTFSKAITDDVMSYREITSGLYAIRADKDSNGKTINGSAKKKKKAYIWSLDIDDGAKYILFKNEYNSVDDYNDEIVDYLNSRDDITYDEMNTILEQLGAKVDDEGYISW